ncbi:MAG: DegT/DnrJ/EryC1/StrS family aminotransferase, partial [Pauljensenia sp.]
TFAATANSVVLAGARPVFADIDLATFTLDPASVEAAITERTAAIEVVHLYGLPANMPAIMRIAEAHGLAVFEDCAQAHGAAIGSVPVGAFGAWGSFSFYPTKNMTSGEGGMVTSRDPALVRWVRLARNQGMEKRYENEIVGLNNRMTDIHAAIGRVQLTKIDAWTAERQSNAAYLSAHLRGVTVPHVAPGATHVFHQYTIRVPQDRDGFARALREEYGIGSGVYYPIPAHELASLARFAPDTDLPATRAAAAEVLSLPVYPSLTRGDLDRIVEAVNALAEAGA